MIGHTWVRVSGFIASASFMLLSCSPGVVWAQSTERSQSGTTPPPFLVAPSFALAGVHTSVATGDLNRDGKPDLITTNEAAGNVTVFLGTGEGKFATGVDYPAGPHPGSVIVADIDGDGRPDVIVVNTLEGTVTVLSGGGDGRLQLKQSYAIGFTPAFIATGDLNGNGKTDVVAVSKSGRALAVLSNDGKGNLVAKAPILLSKEATSLTIADFNNDEHADLALANADGTVNILLGMGNGTFRSGHDVHVGSGTMSSIVAADFDKDGKVDLAVTRPDQRLVSVLMGKGDGEFAPAAHYPVGNNPVSAVVADVDGDGVPDLVVVNRDSNSFSVLGGFGDGSFKTSQDFVVGKEPVALAAGDFDGDGRIDLAVLNSSSQTVSVPLGNGDGTFRAARTYAAQFRPRSIASGDLNGDNKADLVVTNYCGSDAACSKGGSVSIFLASDGGGYRLSSSYPLGSGPSSVALADLNGDKILDIIALNRDDKTVTVQLGLGDGSFQQPFTFSEPEAPVAFAVGDFNHDGKPDLAIVGDCGEEKCSQPGTLDILIGSGDGSFHSTQIYPVGYSPSSVAIGSLNKGSNVSIVVANRCGKDASCKSSGTASIFLGDGKGKFQQGSDLGLGASPSSISLTDLSGRGMLDLAVSRSGDNTLALFRGNGDGSFHAPVSYKVGAGPRAIAVADFNGDGVPDVAVTNYTDATVSVLFGNGDGTLQSAANFPVGSGPDSLTVIAGTGGRHASLATANGNSESTTPGTEISVLTNVHSEVNPEFTTATTTLAAPTPATVNGVVTFTATVNPPVGTEFGTPTGTVTFSAVAVGTTPSVNLVCSNATIAVTTVALDSNGSAACQTDVLQAGSYTVTAAYNGDPTYAANTSAPITQVVNKAAATLALTASPAAPYTVGGSVTFKATIPTIALTPVTPAGKVSININGTAPAGCSSLDVSSGSVSCNYKFPSVQTYSVQAVYVGTDNNFTITNSNTLAPTVGKATATIHLASVPNPSSVNQSDALTVTVTPPTGGAVPTGNVTFSAVALGTSPAANLACSNATTQPATVSLNSSGTATCDTQTLLAGSYTVSAAYAGDGSYSAGNSNSVTQVVNKAAATLGLSASPAAPYSVGNTVTLTASLSTIPLSPTAPTGTVTININGAAPTGCSNLSITSGTASCSYKFTLAQSYVAQAVYVGTDNNFAITSSTNLTLPVGKATTQNTLSSATNPSSVNQSVALTVTVTPPSGGTAPVGSVQFFMSGTPIPCVGGNAVSLAGGTATCNYAFTTVSSGVPITATYSGDTNYPSGAATPTVNQVVNKSGTSTALTSAPNPSAVDATVAFTATVTPTFSGAAKPGGSVTFTDTTTGTTLCPPNVALASGTAACNASFGSSGPHQIVATYGGDGSFSSSPSTPYQQSVGKGNPIVTQKPTSQNPSAVNQSVTFTATVASSSSTSTAPSPTGTVTFSYTVSGVTTNICQNTQTPTTKGTPTTFSCAAPLSSAGTFSVVASYGGDTNFNAASSATQGQTVQKATTTVTGLAASPSPSFVNQSIRFSAQVNTVPSDQGLTLPTGMVTFSNGATQLCQVTLVGGVIPSPSPCTGVLGAAGSYSNITATYGGDGNFQASPASAPFSQTVQPAPTVVTITSATPTSVVSQPVLFTATVAPQPGFVGAIVPSGTLTFSLPPGTANPCTPLTPPGTGTSPNPTTCALAFPAPGGLITVDSTYNGDPNFQPSTGSISQAVQDFKLAFTVTSTGILPYSGTVYLSQGSISSGDPFNSVKILLKASPTNAYGFGDQLKATCSVSDSTGVTVTNVTCAPTPSSGTLPGDGSAAASLSYTLTAASTAPVGPYTLTVTAADVTTPTLSHSTTLGVIVLQTAPASVSSTGSTSVTITTANTVDLGSLSCSSAVGGVVAINADGTFTATSLKALGLTCSNFAAGSGTNVYTFTISANQTTAAQRSRPGNIAVAAMLGSPLILLFGLLSGTKSRRKSIYRLFALLVLCYAGLQSIGCGGGFKVPPTTTATGSYDLQIVSTAGGTTTTVAIVALNVGH